MTKTLHNKIILFYANFMLSFIIVDYWTKSTRIVFEKGESKCRLFLKVADNCATAEVPRVPGPLHHSGQFHHRRPCAN
jgi:hypothetical protein